jgi:hypothetical protein
LQCSIPSCMRGMRNTIPLLVADLGSANDTYTTVAIPVLTLVRLRTFRRGPEVILIDVNLRPPSHDDDVWSE